MKTLDRYILRSFFVNYVIAMTILIGLYVMLDLFINLDEFTGMRTTGTMQTLGRIVDFYGHNLFLYFAQLAGVISVVAACFTLGRLHSSNEMTAILSAGASLYRVATPILLAGLAMNCLWFVDQEFIIPNIAQKLARKHGDLEGMKTFSVYFLPDRQNGNALLSADRFNPTAMQMRGVVVLKRDDKNRMTEVIQADQARWDPERGTWHFENGFATTLAAGDVDGDIAGLGHRPIEDYKSSLTPREMALQQSAQWTQFLSLKELNRLQNYFSAAGVAEFVRMKHARLTTVFMNMTLLCIGIPFFLNRERPSIIVLGGKCLLACGLCYAATFICNTVEITGFNIDPALPPWLPFIVFAPLAVVLLEGIKT
ncbi:MAG: LptF/LptG family permease [Phycisphaerales bacterium]|nr:LptF/LptG family permease [Phycisphaerales bacterium]MCB9855881.1 LptF/LptG family permease [Phycisphaerales bacterium]